MKITFGQFEPKIGNKEYNLNKMKQMMEQAALEKSNIILFPELCLTGYFIQNIVSDVAEPVDGESIRQIQKLSKKYQLHTVFSWPELGQDKNIYNSSCLINDQGDVVGTYQKIHLYDREKEIFTRGNSFQVYRTPYGNIGLLICFDLDFPESARILKLKGADIILVATNYFEPYDRYQTIYLKSRSMENEIPIALCNRTGQEENLKYFGESAAYDSSGQPLAVLGQNEQTKTIKVPIKYKGDSNLNYLNNRYSQDYKTLVD